jgi:transcriptional regulator with XRE-family HTH domain
MKIVLGRQLKQLRQLADLTQDQVAANLGCPQRKVEHMENGGGIKAADLDALLQHYNANETDSAYALDLHQECSRKAKRTEFRTRLRQYARLRTDIELSCHQISCYRSMAVPELLQTEDYMRTVLRAWRPSRTAAELERDTRNRLARQSVLENLEQRFWFIIDEAVLHKNAGDTRIKKAQLRRLIELSDRTNIELQVVPFDAGYYMGQGYDYTIFSYDTADVVHCEHYEGEYVYDAGLTAKYKSVWDHQVAAAHGPRRTRRDLVDLVDTL